MSKFYWGMKACGIFLLWATAAVALPAQTTITSPHAPKFTTLHSFEGTDGDGPDFGALVQGTDGKFYGTTYGGGANSAGAVFKITPTGTLTTLYNFCSQSGCADGTTPHAGLALGMDGKFYGMTYFGGNTDGCDYPDGCGTAFTITSAGMFSTLHIFDDPVGDGDGAFPTGSLVQGLNGNLYGTTEQGNGPGTVFEITPRGAVNVLYNFCAQAGCADGGYPEGGLVLGSDGSFYGTTALYGVNGYGTVFKITPTGNLTTLHSFDFTDGATPLAPLVQGTDGSFYGTTQNGGNSYCPENEPCGTVFRITPAGALTTLHTFCNQANCPDGNDVAGGLVQATDGSFYGTTILGGSNCSVGCGTIYNITSTGTLTTLHSFDDTDGAGPQAALVQGTNGILYGTTYYGGAINTCGPPYGCGTVFSLSVGLGPFVETNPAFGKVGTAVRVLGNNLTGATSVTFGGTAATFTVISPSEFTTTVPAGALTGPVDVTVGATTLTSAQTFRVTPTITSFSPPSGLVGTPVTITGTGLAQTSKVTFNNTTATFTVNSDTQVTATVPTGATTGKIAITTPGGTATSATSFTVN